MRSARGDGLPALRSVPPARPWARSALPARSVHRVGPDGPVGPVGPDGPVGPRGPDDGGPPGRDGAVRLGTSRRGIRPANRTTRPRTAMMIGTEAPITRPISCTEVLPGLRFIRPSAISDEPIMKFAAAPRLGARRPRFSSSATPRFSTYAVVRVSTTAESAGMMLPSAANWTPSRRFAVVSTRNPGTCTMKRNHGWPLMS